MFWPIMIAGCSIWILTYLLIIRLSLRDRCHCIPLIAVPLCMCWEGTLAFVTPPPHDLKWCLYAWFLADLGVASVTLRFAPAQFSRLPKRLVYAVFALAAAIGMPLVLTVNKALDDSWGNYSAYFINLAMSAMFLAMLYSRGSSRGQSIGIAASKLLGTGLVSLSFALYPSAFPHSPLLWTLWIAVFVLDTVYLVALLRVRAGERRGALLEPLLRARETAPAR